MTSEVAYLERRLAEERSAALASLQPTVRDTHLELSRLYEARLRALDRNDQRIELVSL